MTREEKAKRDQAIAADLTRGEKVSVLALTHDVSDETVYRIRRRFHICGSKSLNVRKVGGKNRSLSQS